MKAAALMLIGFMAVVIGHAGYEAAVDEQRTYCAMVAEGTWPDYKGNAEEVCE